MKKDDQKLVLKTQTLKQQTEETVKNCVSERCESSNNTKETIQYYQPKIDLLSAFVTKVGKNDLIGKNNF